MNRLGAKRGKNPSPRQSSGAPLIRLLTSSMAEPTIHDSLGLAEPITLHSTGRACLTTVSYTLGAREEANAVNISAKMERKMGSRKESERVNIIQLGSRGFSSPLLFFAQTSKTATIRE